MFQVTADKNKSLKHTVPKIFLFILFRVLFKDDELTTKVKYVMD